MPVIQQADNYSIAGLAKEINRLAQEVRQGTLAKKWEGPLLLIILEH